MNITSEKINQYFKDLTGYEKPRHFQQEAILNILQNKNTILKAPTGSGKTETAIAPFLFAKLHDLDFPNKLIYVVPLRTLANSLRTRTQDYIKKWNERPNTKNLKDIVVTLQTGENPEDPRFEGDIIFCTIDQMLSSFLNIPYSVGRGSANVNAGAIFASYLVFDELHLLDPDRSFATVLKVLEQAKSISPFLLMTATLTQELVEEIESVISQQAKSDIATIVVDRDLAEIEGDRKRTFEAVDEPLSAELILNDIKKRDRKRVIVIVNTVSVSQGLFRDLDALTKDNDDIVVTLLHSRFLPGDRKEKENNLETVFGKKWKKHDDGRCHVLISTQVIEVGINITSEVMHVQLCPMSSLLQRAGRCARFAEDNKGEVRVYENVAIEKDNQELAQADTDDAEAELIGNQPEKKKRFLPYDDDVCEKTRDVLRVHTKNNLGQSVGFATEDDWIQQVHHKESDLQRKRRQNNRLEFENKFRDAIFEGDRSTARQLIRFVDNRNIYSTPEKSLIDIDEPEVDLNQLEAFSVPKTSLLKAWRDFQEAGHQTWLFKRIENPQGDKAETYSQPVATKIESSGEIVASFRLLVNPEYIFYDPQGKLGLRFNVKNPEDEDSNDRFTSRKKKTEFVKSEYEYHMDTYVQHLGMMWDCWHHKFPPENSKDKITYTSIRDELLRSGGRFIREKIFTQASKKEAEALFELLVMFAILTHDLGKLQVKWQSVMRGWQQIAHDEFGFEDPKSYLLAHTDHKPSVKEIKAAYDDHMSKDKRPPHAVESALLAEEFLDSHLAPILEHSFDADEEQIENIFGVIQMAAGRHHSAWAKGWKLSDVAQNETIELVGNANDAIAESWQQLSKKIDLPESISFSSKSFKFKDIPRDSETIKFEAKTIDLNFFDPDSLEYQQLYALVVRALRLCDMRSVQLLG